MLHPELPSKTSCRVLILFPTFSCAESNWGNRTASPAPPPARPFRPFAYNQRSSLGSAFPLRTLTPGLAFLSAAWTRARAEAATENETAQGQGSLHALLSSRNRVRWKPKARGSGCPVRASFCLTWWAQIKLPSLQPARKWVLFYGLHLGLVGHQVWVPLREIWDFSVTDLCWR